MDELTELAAWTSELGRSRVLPAHVQRRARAILVDDLAAMVAAADEPEVTAVARIAAERGPGGEARIIAAGNRVQRGWAAVANAVATNWTELDEGYRPATCHGGLYSVPAALAEVEATGGTLGDALTAIVAGYEVATRAARAFVAPRPPRLHPHATLAPLGAAATVAAARGADARTMLDTLTAAAGFSLTGPFSHAAQGALIRNAWPGAGAWLGFAAADFAAAGLAGSPTSFTDVFQHSQGGDPRPGALTDGLGERFAVEDGYHKLYACCQYTHAAVEAALSLWKDDQPAITSILVESHPLALSLSDASPTNTLAGKFSLPHTVAAVLATGSASPATFGRAVLDDPRVAALRSVVSLAPYAPLPAAPHDRPARVTVTTADGGVSHAEVLSSFGSPDRPLGEADLLAKITSITRPAFATTAAALLRGEIADTVPLSDVVDRLLTRH